MDNIGTPQFGMMTGVIISLGFFAMLFGVVYLYKRERMAMIERGMDPRRYKPRSAPYQTLKWGLLMIGAGLGLFLAYTLDRTLFKSAEDDNNVAIYFALIAMFGGLGLFASFRIEKKETVDKNEQE
jgi:O-antigen/teichoic acid export membrane protein